MGGLMRVKSELRDTLSLSHFSQRKVTRIA